VLQCVAVCCNIRHLEGRVYLLSLPRAVFCSVLKYVAVFCSVLQRVAVCCSVLQCFAVFCSVLQCVAVFLVSSDCGLFEQHVLSKLQCVAVAMCCGESVGKYCLNSMSDSAECVAIAVAVCCSRLKYVAVSPRGNTAVPT